MLTALTSPMTVEPELLRAAARNNAEWCVAMWVSHGLSVERENGVYFTRSAPPPFYPNAVVAELVEDPVGQAAFIATLAQGAQPFAVKDSFAMLDLGPFDFWKLFRADWLAYRIVDKEHPGTRWRRVHRSSELRRWVPAWSALNRTDGQVFTPALLDDPRVAILAGQDASGTIDRGVVAFDAAGVIGITNSFGDADGLDATLGSLFEEPTVVSFSRQAPDCIPKLKGNRLGPLRVWAR